MKIKKISENIYEIEKEGKMNVPVRIFASEKLFEKIKEDKTIEQAINMAMMSGVKKYIVVLPDAHQGYGACIGGVAAYDLKEGVISPGEIGYDINCGVRLLKSSLTKADLQPYLEKLGSALYNEIPSGVGKGGSIKLKNPDLNKILKHGAQQAIKFGYGNPEDIEQFCNISK